MPQRTAQAHWNGDLRSGSGRVRLGSGAFEGAFSYASRFETGSGTNPEELIAAAHAGCISMATASGLGKAGFKPEEIATTATVHLESVSGGFKIARIDLDLEADVPNIDEAKFLEIAEAAKKNCPVSQALAAVPEITVRARLRQKAG
ncbi:MAG TPA: OsmC family protein [Candidatus Eremiobacteraceae bacterium]|nr:OsmC family protein [Candidatus Eremiobacteraceae bacterium]